MTLVWTLYELAKHPEYQNKVREEISETRARVVERGDSEITISDLDSMHYLPAIMKVCFCFCFLLGLGKGL